MGRDDFRKGGFSKSSGSALDAFEAAMRGSNHTDGAAVRNIAEEFFANLTENAENISNRESFSFSIEARIDGGAAQWNLFKRTIYAALRKLEVSDYCLGHNGGDGFYNPNRAGFGEDNPISRIGFFNRPLTPECPCCRDSRDVRREDDDLFQCQSENCALMFRVDDSFSPYFGGRYPNCDICEDAEDVYWNDDIDHCGDCNEDYDEYGCGPFTCGDCSHCINDEGSCVDPECDCEDWDDDDDDDDDDY